MTLISRSPKPLGGQEPESIPAGSGQQCAESNEVPSAHRLTAVRGPMAPEVAVMFSLLMRQMDRLRESSCGATTESDDVPQAAVRVD
jgi:hypothetical protein